jgi:TPR repeat protein
MAHKLVRCLEGHVYDSIVHKKCPVCGSSQAAGATPSKKSEQAQGEGVLETALGRVKGITALKDHASLDALKKLDKRLLLGGACGAVLLLVIGAWAGGLFGGSREHREFRQVSDKSDNNGSVRQPDTDLKKEPDNPKKGENRTTQSGQTNDCDRYAMSPIDPDRVNGVSGVAHIGNINPALAVAACERAVQDFPNERRFLTGLGRAYRAAKNNGRAMDAYKQAMDKGSAFAAYGYALMVRDGAGMQPNPGEARSLLLKAADAGVPGAMVDYGDMLDMGSGGQRNVQEAERWLKRAVEVNYLPAYSRLGTLYLEGRPGPTEVAKARELFEFAAKQKDPAGIAKLGFLYENGLGVQKDPAMARTQYLMAADGGDTWAMRRIALMLVAGTLAPREPGEAQRWLMQAANSGDVGAMTDLGYGFKTGKLGGVPDYSTSRQWFERAAEAGNAEAMNEIGMAYHTAQGVPRDYGMARSWYERAVGFGNIEATANLGVLYEFGNGVPQNFSKAWQLFEDAAERGSAFAMFHMGQMTQYGKGMEPDLTQAAKWYVKAGEAGNADANWRAMLLFDRFAESKNLSELSALALKAAKGGSQEALQVLFREPGRISQETRAAIETELESKGFFAGPVRGRFDRKSREALEAYLRSGQ